MTDRTWERILITGAAGRIGTTLRFGLAGRHPRFRLLDRRQIEGVRSDEEAIAAELRDRAALARAVDGVDAMVHLAGAPDPRDFEEMDIVPKGRFDAFWDAMPPPVPGSLTLIHIVAADDAAHDFGTGAAYVAEIERAGQKVQRLVDRLDPARDTLFVTADHGHLDRGGHGGTEPDVLAVPLIAFGAGITPAPGAVAEPWCGSILDLPVTLAARLGVAPPAASMGGLLPIAVPRAEGFNAALVAQSTAVHDALGPAGPSAIALGRARPLSLKGGGIGFLAWLALTLLLGRTVVGTLARSLSSALVLPLVFVVAYALLEPTVSLSAVWLEDPWTLRLGAIAAAAATLASLVVFARHAPAESVRLLSLGGALPVLVALGAHASIAAGPVLGDPHAAFAVVAADLFAAAALAVVLLAALVAWLRDRSRGRAKVWF